MEHRDYRAVRPKPVCLLVKWVGVAAVLGIAVATGAAQISPGPLTKAHRELNGPLKCGQCHTFGVGTPLPRCMHCHGEIRKSLEVNHGYHVHLMRGSQDEKKCTTCHAEHAGEAHTLVPSTFPSGSFKHEQTGLAMEGAHVGLQCRDCHKAANIAPSGRTALKVRSLDRTYFGLRPECSTCHADPHRGSLGGECTKCHNQSAWTPASSFDHSQTRFVLTGRHFGVDCEGCHKPVARKVGEVPAKAAPVARVFSGIGFSDCDACHKDPHAGSFKFSCWQCHQTSGWQDLKSRTPFDHNSTTFSLKGAHALVSCGKCHAGASFQTPVAHSQCGDCHPDPHDGQFAGREDNDCAGCHTEEAFHPSTFDLSKHESTRFPLSGKHAAASCASCHPGEKASANFHPAFDRCTACHEDAHEGQLAGEPWRNDCERCHRVEGFAPSSFSFADHDKLKFRLEGAHRAVACSDCHSVELPADGLQLAAKPMAPAEPRSRVSAARWEFHPPAAMCGDCHKDPHGFAEGPLAASGGAPDCAGCHMLAGWNETKPFDHARTQFSLKGAHRAVSCLRCHHVEGKLTAEVRLAFHAAPAECAQCHEDPHVGQFDRMSGSQGCATCHSPDRWKPAEFDHDGQTSFSLAGAHERVPCRQCHTRTELRDNRPVLIYAEVPGRCVECHQ